MLAQAEAQEQTARTTLEDNQRRHEAAHLRETLHVGDTCPVCQTTVGEIPTTQEAGEDLKEFQAQVERAARVAQQKRTEAQEAGTEVAALQVRLDTAKSELEERGRVRQEVQARFAASFPGYASPPEALRAVQTQREELSVALKDMEAQLGSAEQEQTKLSGPPRSRTTRRGKAR